MSEHEPKSRSSLAHMKHAEELHAHLEGVEDGLSRRILEQISESGIVSHATFLETIDSCRSNSSTHTLVAKVVRELMRKKILSEWQVRMCLNEKSGILRLGQNELTGEVKEGGMGGVFAAQHKMLGDEWRAAKFPELANDPSLAGRFIKESVVTRYLCHLDQTHFLTMHDSDVTETHGAYYIMERINGRSLSEVVQKDNVLPDGRALHITYEVAKGLAVMEEHGVTHRDLKPSNIMVTKNDGRVVIVDLGLCGVAEDNAQLRAEIIKAKKKAIELAAHRGVGLALEDEEEKTHSQLVAGTVDYMSPEQCKGLRNAIPKSDVYSLGGVLWYLKTGKVPHSDADSIFAKMHQHTSFGLPQNLPTESSALKEIYRKMSHRVPEKRLAPAELVQLIEELCPEVTGKAVSQRIDGQRFSTRSKVATIGGGIALLGALGVYLATRDSDSAGPNVDNGNTVLNGANGAEHPEENKISIGAPVPDGKGGFELHGLGITIGPENFLKKSPDGKTEVGLVFIPESDHERMLAPFKEKGLIPDFDFDMFPKRENKIAFIAQTPNGGFVINFFQSFIGYFVPPPLQGGAEKGRSYMYCWEKGVHSKENVPGMNNPHIRAIFEGLQTVESLDVTEVPEGLRLLPRSDYLKFVNGYLRMYMDNAALKGGHSGEPEGK